MQVHDSVKKKFGRSLLKIVDRVCEVESRIVLFIFLLSIQYSKSILIW